MTRKAMWLPVIGLGVIGLVTLVAWAEQERAEAITLDQVSAAVKATTFKESASGKITEIERETKNGRAIYEAEFLRDGQEIELQIAPDGTLLGQEIESAEDDDDDDGEDDDQLSGLRGGARVRSFASSSRRVETRLKASAAARMLMTGDDVHPAGRRLRPRA